MSTENKLPPSGAIPREIKITMLQSLKNGYFDSEALEVMRAFLFPNGEPIIIEVIDSRDKVDKNE